MLKETRESGVTKMQIFAEVNADQRLTIEEAIEADSKGVLQA